MSEKLSPEEFGIALIESGDLDPDYIFMVNVRDRLDLSHAEMCEWVLLKSVIYDSVSELEHMLFQRPLAQLAYGAERRKFKPNADKIIAAFRQRVAHTCGNLESFFFEWLPRDANHALASLQSIKGFGPWASWKLCDLMDRVLGVPMDFTKVDFRVAYNYPLRGVLLLAGQDEGKLGWLSTNYRTALKLAIGKLGEAQLLQAPPQRDRLVNIQEFETVFCKYHSYWHGHYFPGKDIKHLRERIHASDYREIQDLLPCAPANY